MSATDKQERILHGAIQRNGLIPNHNAREGQKMIQRLWNDPRREHQILRLRGTDTVRYNWIDWSWI